MLGYLLIPPMEFTKLNARSRLSPRAGSGRSLAAILTILSFCTGNSFAQNQSTDGLPPLRWAADAEGGAPYIFKDPHDPRKNIGYEVDLAAALAKQLGREIQFEQYNFDSLVSGLERGDFDFVMNGLEMTPDRISRLRFSRPYYVYRLQLVTRANDDRIASLEDCHRLGAVVGTLGETAASRMLDAEGIQAKVYDAQREPYTDLQLERIDAVLLDLPIAIYYAKDNPALKFVGNPVGRGYYAIAFRLEQETLASEFDAAIEQLAASGELRRLYEKWRIWNDDQQLLAEPGLREAALAELKNATPEQAAPPAWQFRNYLPLLVEAAWVTIKISLLSMTLAMAIGLVVSLARLYGPLPVRVLAITYVEFFRGIPVLLLLYLLYYGLPALVAQADWGFEFKPSDMTVAVLAFGLNYAAYEAEIYRAGISSIPIGQWEAAASLGMPKVTTFRRIILPQAMRTIIPPVTNDFVALFKDTSVVSVIAVVELTKQYQMLAKSSLKYFEVGAATAVLYLIMSIPLGYLARRLEQRWGKGQ